MAAEQRWQEYEGVQEGENVSATASSKPNSNWMGKNCDTSVSMVSGFTQNRVFASSLGSAVKRNGDQRNSMEKSRNLRHLTNQELIERKAKGLYFEYSDKFHLLPTQG